MTVDQDKNQPIRARHVGSEYEQSATAFAGRRFPGERVPAATATS